MALHGAQSRKHRGHSPPRQQAIPHCPQGLRGQIPNDAAAGVKPTAGGAATVALVGVLATGVASIPSLLTTAFWRWG